MKLTYSIIFALFVFLLSFGESQLEIGNRCEGDIECKSECCDRRTLMCKINDSYDCYRARERQRCYRDSDCLSDCCPGNECESELSENCGKYRGKW